MPSYILDIETLLILIGRLKRSGTLMADVQLPRLGRCIAQITIQQGVLTICIVIDANGQILAQGEQALGYLSHRQVEWSWKHIPGPSSLSVGGGERSQQGGASSKPIVPRLQGYVTQQYLQNFPRNERRILLLVDGFHSIAEIAHLLTLSEQSVRESLFRFREKGLLFFEE